MENQENCFAKTSSEAIKNLISRAVPENKKNTKYTINVFEGTKTKHCEFDYCYF